MAFKKSQLVVIAILFSFFAITATESEQNKSHWEHSPYLDTNFLKNPALVRKALLEEEGFQEGDFKTEDQVPIHYLWKKRPNARVTMICCAGFFPGKKEGVASLYAMMPEDTNILLFDARGHGQSGGSCKKVWRYGIDEYQDIIGAIDYAHRQDSECPIVLWSICSGSFNAAHAVHRLAQTNTLDKYKVKGLVFDSGWASYKKVSFSGPVSEVNSRIQWVISTCLGKNYVSDSLTAGCTKATRFFLHLIHRYLYTPLINRYEATTTLHDKIHEIPVPMLYIHSEDDSYVDISEARELAEKSTESTQWWIQDPSKHACHHLKHKTHYRTKLLDFIKAALEHRKQE